MTVRDVGMAALVCLLAVGCNRGRDERQAEPRADTVAAAPEVPPLSDNQALDVLMAMSAAGAQASDSVPPAVSTPDVRRYLNVVRADHQALEAELKVIADSLQLSPEPHPAADRMRAAAQDARLLVQQQGYGTADAAAVAQQVRLHTLFLGVLDSAVMRGARQELLAQYAAAARPTVAAHLQRAQQLEQLLREHPVAMRPAAPARPPIDTPPRPRPAAIETGIRPPPDTTMHRP